MSDEARVALQVMQEILQHMDFPATVEAQEDAEQITLTLISDKPMGLLIGKSGQTLNAIELVVKTIVQAKLHNLHKHIVLDAEGYRERHTERLRELARSAAAQALETGAPVPLEPMNPRDRRTVHMVIAETEGVESVSAGAEPYRHVIVCLPGQCQDEAEG